MSAKIIASEPPHFAYIDAVRGLAFLAVLFAHVSVIDGCFPGWWAWSVGYYGVQFFFLASAITLCYSMESRKTKDKRPVLSFFIRRLFRIGPMFWLAILLYWTLPFESIRHDWLRPFSGETGPAGLDFGLNALFLHGWVPSAFNSVVPGGWSIGVEMTFYLIFPALFFKINSLSRAALGVFVGTLFAIIYFQKIGPFCQAHFYSDNKIPWFFTQFSFPAQFAVFLIGIFIYHLLRNENLKVLTKNKTGSVYLLISSLSFLASFLKFGGGSGFIPISILVVLAMAGIIVALSGQTMPLLINAWLRYLGKISYSCYLIHFAVLSLVLKYFKIDISLFAHHVNSLSSLENFFIYLKITVMTLVITTGISTLTLHLVENPGIALGRRLIERLNKAS